MIYEVRIVERNGKNSEITAFVVDYHCKTIKQVKKLRDKLLKNGHTLNELDIVMYADKDLDTYLGTIDASSLKDTGY